MTTWPQLPDLLDIDCVLGADNGKSGHLVFLDVNDATILHIEPYPDNAKRLYELLRFFKPKYAVIEAVFMSSGFAHVASTNFEIMGRYMQTFELLDIKYEAVRAVSWRKSLNIKAKGRQAQKDAAINYAKEHFSEEDFEKLKTTRNAIVEHKRQQITYPDDNKCESALIALYALNKWRQQGDN